MSTIEAPVGIVCACLPAIRSLLGVVCPRVFDSSRYSTMTNEPRIKSSCSRSGSSGNHLRQDNRRTANNFDTHGHSNTISVRHEWTVRREPVAERNNNPSRDGSDIELVGVGISVPTHDISGGDNRITPQTSGAEIEAVSPLRSEMPWDGTMRSGRGNDTGRTFYESSSDGNHMGDSPS